MTGCEFQKEADPVATYAYTCTAHDSTLPRFVSPGDVVDNLCPVAAQMRAPDRGTLLRVLEDVGSFHEGDLIRFSHVHHQGFWVATYAMSGLHHKNGTLSADALEKNLVETVAMQAARRLCGGDSV